MNCDKKNDKCELKEKKVSSVRFKEHIKKSFFI